jgi:hypothetical protein
MGESLGDAGPAGQAPFSSGDGAPDNVEQRRAGARFVRRGGLRNAPVAGSSRRLQRPMIQMEVAVPFRFRGKKERPPVQILGQGDSAIERELLRVLRKPGGYSAMLLTTRENLIESLRAYGEDTVAALVPALSDDDLDRVFTLADRYQFIVADEKPHGHALVLAAIEVVEGGPREPKLLPKV